MQDLPQSVIKGAASFASSKDFPDAAFRELIEGSFGVLLNKSSEEDILGIPKHPSKLNSLGAPNLSKLDSIDVKRAYGSLVSLILESAKINADPSLVKEILIQEGVDSKRVETISKLYSDTKTALRTILASTTFHLPQVIGVDWRLDYYMKSNTQEKINLPIYTVSIDLDKTTHTSQIQTREEENEEDTNRTDTSKDKLTFSCNQDQLTDLVTKLRDAVKQLERTHNTL